METKQELINSISALCDELSETAAQLVKIRCRLSQLKIDDIKRAEENKERLLSTDFGRNRAMRLLKEAEEELLQDCNFLDFKKWGLTHEVEVENGK